MEIKENNQKKLLLSVLGVAILVVAVIGISFAIYQATFSQTKDNSITTGTITVSYEESNNIINIEDAMPMTEEEALTQENNKFEFTVTTGASGSLTVPYDISITKIDSEDGNGLEDSDIRVYLTDGTQQPVELSTNEDSQNLYQSSSTKSRLISELNEYTKREDGKTKLLYSTHEVFDGSGEKTKSTNYTLRMWVDEKYQMGNEDEQKTYKAKVNVDSVVTPLSQE